MFYQAPTISSTFSLFLSTTADIALYDGCQPIDGDRVDPIVLPDPQLQWWSESFMVKKAFQILLPTLMVYDVGTFEEGAHIQHIYLAGDEMSQKLGIGADYVAGHMYCALR